MGKGIGESYVQNHMWHLMLDGTGWRKMCTWAVTRSKGGGAGHEPAGLAQGATRACQQGDCATAAWT